MNRKPTQERKPAPKASSSSTKTTGAGALRDKSKDAKPSLDKTYGTPTAKTSAPKPKPKPKLVSDPSANSAVKSGPLKPSAVTTTRNRGPLPVQRTTNSLTSRTGKVAVDGGTTRKELPKVKPAPPTITKPPPPKEDTIEDYDDDFEEDYQSDFEDDFPEETESPHPSQAENKEASEDDAEESEESTTANNADNTNPINVTETRKVARPVSTSFFGSSKPSEAKGNEEMAAGQQEQSALVSVKMPNFDFKKAHDSSRKSGRMKRAKELLSIISLRSTRLFTTVQFGPAVPNRKNTLYMNSKDVQTIKPTQARSCQTLPIRKANSWTQRPPTWSSKRADKLDIKLLREEALGVGQEAVPLSREEKEEERFQLLSGEANNAHQMKWEQEVGSSWNQITRFICRASRKVLYVLESQKRVNMKEEMEVRLARSVELLADFDLGVLHCSGHFLAAANFYPEGKSLVKSEAKTIISVWSLKEPSCPRYFLKMFGKVSAISLFPFGHLVVAGGRRGGLSLWDLDVSPEYHTAFEGHVIRTPNIDTSLLPDNHSETVIGLEVMINPELENHYHILSLDRLGTLKLWGLRRSHKIIMQPENPKNTAYWSKISLSHKTTLRLNESLTKEKEIFINSFKLGLEEGQKFRFFCGTDNGFLLQGNLTILGEEKGREEEEEEEEEEDHFDSEDEEAEVQKVLERQRKDKEKANKPKVERKWFALSDLQKYWDPESSPSSMVTCFDYNSSLNICLVGSYDCKCRVYSCSKDARAPLLLTLTCKGPPIRIHFSGVRSSVFYVALQDQLCTYELLKDKANPKKVVDLPKLTDLELYRSLQSEFAVTLAGNELRVSPLAGELKGLTEQEERKLNAIIGRVSHQVQNGEAS